MDISAAMPEDLPAPSVVGSDCGTSGLSVLQRNFVACYVQNGGKAQLAAIQAGYAESSAHVSATKNLANLKIAAEIQRRCRSAVHAALPVAIQTLLEICSDKDVKPEIRRKAANDILERGGIATDKAGTTVNVGVSVSGGQVQQLIGSIEAQRERRMSGIAGGMSDTDQRQIDALATAVDQLTDGRPGGDQDQGPAPARVHLPPPSSANGAEGDDFTPAGDD